MLPTVPRWIAMPLSVLFHGCRLLGSVAIGAAVGYYILGAIFSELIHMIYGILI